MAGWFVHDFSLVGPSFIIMPENCQLRCGRWLAGASLFRSAATGAIASAIGYGIAQLRALVH
jgi:hypothetical protein